MKTFLIGFMAAFILQSEGPGSILFAGLLIGLVLRNWRTPDNILTIFVDVGAALGLLAGAKTGYELLGTSLGLATGAFLGAFSGAVAGCIVWMRILLRMSKEPSKKPRRSSPEYREVAAVEVIDTLLIGAILAFILWIPIVAATDFSIWQKFGFLAFFYVIVTAFVVFISFWGATILQLFSRLRK